MRSLQIPAPQFLDRAAEAERLVTHRDEPPRSLRPTGISSSARCRALVNRSTAAVLTSCLCSARVRRGQHSVISPPSSGRMDQARAGATADDRTVPGSGRASNVVGDARSIAASPEHWAGGEACRESGDQEHVGLREQNPRHAPGNDVRIVHAGHRTGGSCGPHHGALSCAPLRRSRRKRVRGDRPRSAPGGRRASPENYRARLGRAGCP